MHITIIGAGITGCFTAHLLAKSGHTVDIYDSFSPGTGSTASAAKSFNLTLYGYGINVLTQTGIWPDIQPHTTRLNGSITFIGNNSKPPVISHFDADLPYFAVERSLFHQSLLRAVYQNPALRWHLATKLVSVDRHRKMLTFEDQKSRSLYQIHADVVIGCDGVNSLVRPYLQQHQSTIHSQVYSDWTYKQLPLPLPLKPGYMYAWTRKQAVLTALPNQDQSYTAMLLLPPGAAGYQSLTTAAAIKDFITAMFPDLLPILKDITPAILKHPESRLVSMTTSPWYYKDFMVILGDAAHAAYPFYGQGVSAAFGDCLEFVRLLDTSPTDLQAVFSGLQQTRKPHVDTIVHLSKQNFSLYRRESRADYTAIMDKVDSLLFRHGLFTHIATDPNHAALHYRRHQSRRRWYQYLGIPIAAKLLLFFLKVGTSLKKFVLQFPTPTRKIERYA